MKSAAEKQNLPRVHRNLVAQLTQSPAGSLRRGVEPFVQWSAWVGLTALVMGGLVAMLKPRPDIEQNLSNAGFVLFIGFILLGAALSAWGAVLSGIPGRGLARWQKIILGSSLAGLVLVPLFLFPASAPDVDGGRLDDDYCFPLVLAIGLLPWAALGMTLSKNASFRPGLTGLWSGTSAFLMASGALFVCCPCWTRGHLLMAHVLPVALASFATTSLGAYWFSRWNKKN
jgi:hypothetical protein